MSEKNGGPGTGGEHAPHRPGVAHVVTPRMLLAVWGTLLALTAATVAITWIELGSLNLFAALLIASVKATLVALYFMHLRWDRPVYALVFVTAVLFVMIFVGMVLVDTTEYRSELIPGHAPAVNR